MLQLARHLVVLVLTLVVTAGDRAVCAAWQGSAEARMVCCSGPGGCPMHAHGPDGQTGAPACVVSQAHVDGCCASSESGDATQTPQALVWSWARALVAFTLGDMALDVGRQPARAHAAGPPPVRSVPRHLLLAVFLI